MNNMENIKDNLEYEQLSDVLEYGNITDEEAIKICNKLLQESIMESQNNICESIFNAVFNGVNNRNIANRLLLDDVVNNIDKLDNESLDYIISILAYTGEKKYLSILEEIKQNPKYDFLDVDEALEELKYRINRRNQ